MAVHCQTDEKTKAIGMSHQLGPFCFGLTSSRGVYCLPYRYIFENKHILSQIGVQRTFKINNSILLDSYLNPAWHFWLSTRFSCCHKNLNSVLCTEQTISLYHILEVTLQPIEEPRFMLLKIDFVTCQSMTYVISQGGLQNGALTEQFSDMKSVDLGPKLGTQITPQGRIFWTRIFYNLKEIHIKIYLMRGQTLL